jgi:(1->4)-alpha-D-glucan 1-alpha-D-glucosylmutase
VTERLRATYRLQLGPDLGFDAARALVPYLRDLGISHLYLSPSFQARAGSTHGYDVVDPNRLSDELGGEDAFRALAAEARAAGLGIVLDVVPNHMATDDANRLWTEQRERFFDLDPETGHHRRFFDIDHLAGVRQEDPEVFDETHRLALALVRDGVVDGLRIDHPDGLADPVGYLERLRDRGVQRVWVEKIVDPDERLRQSWPVCGTTGYEFLNDVCALFVDPDSQTTLDAVYAELTGETRPFGAIVEEAKREQATGTFAREVEWLRRLWPEVPADVAEAVSALPVYRTYLRDGRVDEQDAVVLRDAGLEWLRGAPADFVTRFQQTTPPVMAKGVEDTAFYRYARLLALNDVGGDPSRFGIGVERFHEGNALRAECWPHAMLTLQTHDAKRSADVRARLVALSWMADEWAALARAVLVDDPPPDDHDGYFLLQTVVAAPLAPERLEGYAEKALRERKVTSGWIEPDEAHETAMARWAVGLLEREDVSAFAERLATPGRRIALAQKLLKLTSPGVPDVYQGDEDELLALVDPDNRRPVDWEVLRTSEPSAKLALTRAALSLDLVGRPYEPLGADPGAIGFLRGADVAVAVPVREGAGRVELPSGRWRDLLGAGVLQDRVAVDRPLLLVRA